MLFCTLLNSWKGVLSSKSSAEILNFDDQSDKFLTTRPVVVWIEILTHVQKCVCCAAV